ncbi:SDR family NAD(P)-dependent oxidoreductase [Providencia stuartii]|uniref:SDR family NAD(P)-dependent oxidoreductase n=1 Tax=Providencia stuartii TaxID=588 RepID=UPI00111E8C7D|nr:SDR family NAD(P)-dependent oxidoreductase [Providencia stuartii]
MKENLNNYHVHTTWQEVLNGISLKDKKYLITGANIGLGKESAKAILSHDGCVILTVRTEEKKQTLYEELISQFDSSLFEIRLLDLASLADIRRFTKELQLESTKLDGVLGNAGIMATDFKYTVDGFEQQFGVNHLGHFVLINRLTACLLKGARIVMMTSGAHRLSNVDLVDPNFNHREYSRWTAYGQSKSANVLFAFEFDRRWKDYNVRAFAVAPGIVLDTNLHLHLQHDDFNELAEKQDTDKVPVKSLQAGVATQIMALCHPEFANKGGIFLEHCNYSQVNGNTRQGTGVIPWVLDTEFGKKLWQLSEEMVNEVFPETAKLAYEISYGELAHNRLPQSQKLELTGIEFKTEDSIIEMFFEQETCTIEGYHHPEVSIPSIANYELIEVRDNLFFVDLLFTENTEITASIAIDFKTNKALFVLTRYQPASTPDQNAPIPLKLASNYQQYFTPAIVLTGNHQVEHSQYPHITKDLIGSRSLYCYSTSIPTVYEHIYINSHWYCYNVINGIRKGDGGCDQVSYYKFDDSTYVVTWRELLIDLSFVFVYDLDNKTTTGKGWGNLSDVNKMINIPAGAHIISLNSLNYPLNYIPT